jgi:methionyl-tRNA formyltransferase
MRIVFLGASRFGLRCLQAIASLPCCTVVGAVSAPETFQISYRPQGVKNVLHADVAGWCAAQGTPCAALGAQGMRDPQLLEQVRAWQPDAFVVAGWYHMVPKAWRDLAPAYGLHGSLLPSYRGGAPLVWSMIQGERQTGITLFQFDDGVDTGPIVSQAATPIRPEDTIATVYARIETLGESLLIDALPRLADRSLQVRPQGEVCTPVWPQRSPQDGQIDWAQPAGRLVDFVRAQTRPYPGAFFLHAGRKVTVWSARVRDDTELPAGEFVVRDGLVLAGAGGGTAIVLDELAIDGVDTDPLTWLAGTGKRVTANSQRFHFTDFTHAAYRRLLQLAAQRYTFAVYDDIGHVPGPLMLWRHDLDFSVHDAVPLAQMEQDAGVIATYFVNLHDPFYNPLDRSNAVAIREILSLGHALGLHFDSGFHDLNGNAERLHGLVRREAAVLSDVFGLPVRVFSFHNPDATTLTLDAEGYGGLRNTYARSLRAAGYCSDSNGHWRHARLEDVLNGPAHPVMQVLTHPCWWTREVMSPREKITHILAGQSASLLADYARTLEAAGRLDIDW